MSTLVVGVPSEIKDNENRVAVQPDGVAELVHDGHQVVVQAGAGVGSRFADAEFAAAGAKIVPTADEVFAAADLIVKVKEPIPAGVPPVPAGPAAVHLPAPGRRPRPDRVPARPAHRLHRLRDRADPGPQAAAAHPDERGRRPDGRAGRRPPPGEPGRRGRASCSAACPAPPRPRSRSSAAASPAPRRPRSRSGCGPWSASSTPTPAGWPTCPTSSAAGSTW